MRNKGGEVGKEFVNKLLRSSSDPFTIILNDNGMVNSADNKNNILIDLSEKRRFMNFADNNIYRDISVTRMIAHELGHALFGYQDSSTLTVISHKPWKSVVGSENVGQIDQIMKNINGTERRWYELTQQD